MGEIAAPELLVALIGRWLQQARGVHRLVAPPFGLDQVMAAEDLGDAQLGGLEVDALASA